MSKINRLGPSKVSLEYLYNLWESEAEFKDSFFVRDDDDTNNPTIFQIIGESNNELICVAHNNGIPCEMMSFDIDKLAKIFVSRKNFHITLQETR